jgi:heme A synthase
MKEKQFARYSWIVLIYTLAVILWGATVRATGSGAGCGAHWPLCNGQVIPRTEQIETLIEFTHRLTSGLAGLLVLIMLVWGIRLYPQSHVVRQGVWLSFLFMLIEGLVGASLVLFEWVADNASAARAVATAVHFTNSIFLVSALTLTAWWASGGPKFRWGSQGRRGWLLGLGLLGLLLLGVTGAITALGDTLFPAVSLNEGIRQDFDATAHFLVQLRVWHPVLAVATTIYLWVISRHLSAGSQGPVKRFANRLRNLLALQLLAGVVNVLLLAPIWMQLVHLLLADLVLILFVLFAATVMAQPENMAEAGQPIDKVTGTSMGVNGNPPGGLNLEVPPVANLREDGSK